MKRSLGAVLLLLVSLSTVQAAAAPSDTKACIAAFDQGQRAVTDKKLRQARQHLLVCAQESCPAVLRADCTGVLQKVEGAIPSVVFAADDGEGHDVTDVRVSLGEDVLATKLDGRSQDFDPGSYELHFERTGPAAGAGGAPTLLTVPVLLREGEKNRVVRASFKKPKGPEPVGAVTDDAMTPRTADALPPPKRSTAGYVIPGVLAAFGVAGLVFSGVQRLSFDSRVEELRGSCAPECTQEQRADLSTTLVTSNVGLGVGIGFVAAAAITWFVLSPSKPARPSTVGWAW